MTNRVSVAIATIISLLLSLQPAGVLPSTQTDTLIFLPMVLNPPPPLEILSANWVTTFGSGEYHAVRTVGEVRNNTNVAVQNVIIEGTSSMGIAAYAYTDADVINPGETSGFVIDFQILNAGFITCSPHWKDLRVTSFEEALFPSIPISIVRETVTETDNFFRVEGICRNDHGSRVGSIAARLRLYNRAGELIGRSMTYVTPSLLQPGQQAIFSISTNSWRDCPGGDHDIYSYELTIEGSKL